MKTKRELLAVTILAILFVSLAAPLVALPTLASDSSEQEDTLKLVPMDNWYKLENGIVTVLFPRGGQKPMFIWWYTGKPDQIYVVKYQGLIEYFTFDGEYYRRMQEAMEERFREMYMEPEEDHLMMMGDSGLWRLEILKEVMQQINETWHRPFFPFREATWNLTQVQNITADSKIIGVSFAFKLVKVPDEMPGFKFAENNIMIRVRFYNATVEETDPDTGYKFTVNAGEMKMDLVINKWVWNIDSIKTLIDHLHEQGIDVTVPQGKTRLALWVNLASINITKLSTAEADPEGIEEDAYEEHSYVASHMEIEDSMHEDIRPNMTLTEQEKPIEIERPMIKLGFANETTTLGGFFRFVSQAKVKDYPNVGDVNMVPVKAAYIAGGAHMRLFIGYPYFGNGTLEHDPSIGVDNVKVDSTPQYSVQAPSGINNVAPVVIGEYQLPLYTFGLAAILVGAITLVAVMIYAFKWKRKTPVNMVGTR